MEEPAQQPVNPLVGVHFVLNACGLNQAGRDKLIVEGFVNMESFAEVTGKEILSMAKSLAARRSAATRLELSILQIKRLKALSQWAHDCKTCGKPIVAAEFDVATQLARLNALEEKKSTEDVSKLHPGKLKKSLNWVNWEIGMTNLLDNINGVSGIPVSYVIRHADNAPAPENETENQMRIRTALREGPSFIADAKTVHGILVGCTIDEEAFAWVEPVMRRENGMVTMNALRQFFDGEDQQASRRDQSKQALKTLVYTNEQKFPFTSYTSKMTRYLTTIGTPARFAIPVEDQVDYLLNGIHTSNEDLKAAKVFVRLNFRKDWLKAVQHLSEIVNLTSKPMEDGRRRGRELSAVDVGGQSKKKVKGHGDDHGGAGLVKTFLEGVDITDLFRKLSEAEYAKLSPQGRKKLYDLRGEAGQGEANERKVAAVAVEQEPEAQTKEAEVEPKGPQNGKAFGKGAYRTK